jgi:hypothetical protein
VSSQPPFWPTNPYPRSDRGEYVETRRLPYSRVPPGQIRAVPAMLARVGRSVDVPLPEDMTRNIAIRAQRIARRIAPRSAVFRRGQVMHGADRLRPDWDLGEIGLFIPSDAIHMLYQDQGIRPFIMWWAEGRTIPMRGPDGRIYFRKAQGVGRRAITGRDHLGRILSSRIKWRHPGLQPRHFIDSAIRAAARAEIDHMNANEILDILERFVGEPIPRGA